MTREIAFVGSCQVSGMAAAARRLLPDHRVSSFHVGASLTGEEILARITDADVVVTGVRDKSPLGAMLGAAALARPGRSIVYLPTFVFTGFHPDMMYLTIDRRQEPGPVGRYHSTIAAAAFIAGVPKRDAPRLFTAHMFARLGYLDAFAAARAAATEAFAREGYDLGPAFAEWSAMARPFMYTMNHPASPVLSRLATLALQRAGLVDAAAEPPRDVADALASATIAPVFPAIARRAGVPGSTDFLRSLTPGQAVAERAMPLTDFVAQSYAIYRRLGPRALKTPRIDAAAATLRAALGAARYPPPVRRLASPSIM